MANKKFRLAYFISHPIQYQAPLMRLLAAQPDIDLRVYYYSDFSVRQTGYQDEGFGTQVKWDIPLLEGYHAEFLPGLFKNPSILPSLNGGLWRALRDFKPHAVWLHGYHTVNQMRVILLAHLLGIPVMLRAESALFDRPRGKAKLLLKKLFFRILEYSVRATLPIGKANSAYWSHYFGKRIKQFGCFYAVDNDFFATRCAEAAQKRDQLRQQLGLEPGRPVILFAAKFMHRKCCPELVQAYLKLTKRNTLKPRPYLLLIGAGEEEAQIRTLAAQAEAGDIRLLGFKNQTELPAYYNLCDLFVLASVDEPWGLSINEAMNAGRAVVVTDQVGCQQDLVEQGRNGAVVGAHDVNGLSLALEDILRDPERCQRMGKESQLIVANYSYQQNIDALRSALNYLASHVANE